MHKILERELCSWKEEIQWKQDRQRKEDLECNDLGGVARNPEGRDPVELEVVEDWDIHLAHKMIEQS